MQMFSMSFANLSSFGIVVILTGNVIYKSRSLQGVFTHIFPLQGLLGNSFILPTDLFFSAIYKQLTRTKGLLILEKTFQIKTLLIKEKTSEINEQIMHLETGQLRLDYSSLEY